jgi:alpha/beta superfamily hydrolase
VIEEEIVGIVLPRGTRAGRLAYPSEAPPTALVLVAPPDASLGGGVDNPVVLALVRGAARGGAAAVCWEDPGEGTSPSSLAGSVETAAGVRAWLAAQSPRHSSLPVMHAGYSRGALVAMLSRRDGAAQLAVAPPLPGGLCVAPVASGRMTVVFPEVDFSAPPTERARLLEELGSERVDVVTLAGEDHFLRDSLGLLEDLACNWVRAYSGPPSPHASSLL